MKTVKDIIISTSEPPVNNVGWLKPLSNGTFKFKVYSFNGWTDIALSTQGPKDPAGTNGKSVTAIELTTNAEGAITGGTATLSDKSIIPITVTQDKKEGA